MWFIYLKGNESAKIKKKTPIMIRTPSQLKGNFYNPPPIKLSDVEKLCEYRYITFMT